jgi:hypothetical protein
MLDEILQVGAGAAHESANYGARNAWNEKQIRALDATV